jgi:hypothetical protein
MIGEVLIVVFICLLSAAAPAAEQQPGAAGFEKLKTLAGDWEGTYQWTGARTDSGSVKAAYYLTGNESALVENLTMGSVLAMTSVYHLDGADLRMTHYCAARNQPRLRANRVDVAGGAIDFAFVDATNLPSADTPHVHGVEIRWIDAGHVTIRFLFDAGAKRSQELLDLTRVGAAAVAPPKAA